MAIRYAVDLIDTERAALREISLPDTFITHFDIDM